MSLAQRFVSVCGLCVYAFSESVPWLSRCFCQDVCQDVSSLRCFVFGQQPVKMFRQYVSSLGVRLCVCVCVCLVSVYVCVCLCLCMFCMFCLSEVVKMFRLYYGFVFTM